MGIIIFLLHDVPAIHAFPVTSVEPGEAPGSETGATAKMKALQDRVAYDEASPAVELR